MIETKRKPVTVGEMLLTEFLEPLALTQTELAEQSGLPRKHVNELCRNRRAVTADTALILSRVFGNSPTSGSTRSDVPTSGTPSTPPNAPRALNAPDL